MRYETHEKLWNAAFGFVAMAMIVLGVGLFVDACNHVVHAQEQPYPNGPVRFHLMRDYAGEVLTTNFRSLTNMEQFLAGQGNHPEDTYTLTIEAYGVTMAGTLRALVQQFQDAMPSVEYEVEAKWKPWPNQTSDVEQAVTVSTRADVDYLLALMRANIASFPGAQ